MAGTGRSSVLQLYKMMLRESQKFTAYNFRTYALRRIKDGFKQHKAESDPETIKSLVKHAEDNLEVIKRQVVIGQLYMDRRLVIEGNAS